MIKSQTYDLHGKPVQQIRTATGISVLLRSCSMLKLDEIVIMDGEDVVHGDYSRFMFSTYGVGKEVVEQVCSEALRRLHRSIDEKAGVPDWKTFMARDVYAPAYRPWPRTLSTAELMEKLFAGNAELFTKREWELVDQPFPYAQHLIYPDTW
jgi:hypothetical protein